MNAILAGLQSRGRALITLLILLLIAGGASYVAAPKEAAPDIDIPIFFITVVYPGVSVNDSERLLLLPLERELQQLANLDEMVSNAGEGFGIVRLDFLPGSDSNTAMLDVQRAVDVAVPELPERAERPVINEVNLDLFPILSIALSGPLEERSLLRKARNLRDRLETIDGVLEADIIGEREEMMEILVDPTVLETYRISFQEVADAIDRNNQLVPAGSVHAGAGRIGLVVPGTIDSMQDMSEIAVRVEEGVVITVGDVAEVRESFMDPLSFARLNGDPAFTLDVRPRTGANVLETVAAVLTELDRARSGWPEALRVTVLQNQAEQIRSLLGDLENTVIIALLLVFLTIIAAMGLRTAILVAVAVPGAFLTGILAISTLGFTLNIVVLFALILVVGMLVDGTIVVVELADRYISEGLHRGEAFLEASQRMAWPIITAVATTMAVFVPMLFWPGMVGEFIVYLPATVIVTLLASLLMALVFIPALGRVFGPVNVAEDESSRRVEGANRVDNSDAGPIISGYACLLGRLCRHPALTLAGVIILAAVLYLLYGLLGRGVVFFPEVEPESLQVRVLARGDLSVWEADELVRQVEHRLMRMKGVEAVNTQTIADQQIRLQQNLPTDTIGILRLELLDWRMRPPAREISASVHDRTRELPGLRIHIREEEQGPRAGLPVVIDLRGEQRSPLQDAVGQVRDLMNDLGGFVNIQDNLPAPGIEVRLLVNREEAARHGADVTLLGQAVQMITSGVVLGVYRPAYSDEEVDIRMRFPLEHRNVGELGRLRVPTAMGMVPITNFVNMEPAPGARVANRINGMPAYRVEADTAEGYLLNEQINRLDKSLKRTGLPEGVQYAFRGQFEDQTEAGRFLMVAFLVSVSLMFMILVTQFNSLSQAFVVMSAIIFSTAGVLLGLLLRGEPFNIVMSGIGVLALAGIVVNNNIVLIDNYNSERRRGADPLKAAVRTGVQRMRPVILTAVTTVLGLSPMVLGLTIDFLNRDIYFGAPATQYWIALATAIAGGLFFATPLTLLVTPAMLAWMKR